jgi:hypothetical protein
MLDGAYYVRCLYLQIQEVPWRINFLSFNLKSRTGEDKLVPAIKVGTVWATRDDRDAEINSVQALLSELSESHEKEYVEVGVDKHLCCLPFKKIDALTAVAMAKQANMNTSIMRAIARFLRRLLGCRILSEERDMRAI